MIGEMRDLETISAALTAAETGHLVIATLHTNDAVKTIDRIVDGYPHHQQSQVRAQLALALTAVVSQRLIPKTDGKGRALALELLINTPAVQNLIREQKIYQIYNVLETGAKDGMVTLDASIKRLYADGRISLAEAKARMKNPAGLTAVPGEVGNTSGSYRSPFAQPAPGAPPASPGTTPQQGPGSATGTSRWRRSDTTQ
jgi:twitching motility protein PilT